MANPLRTRKRVRALHLKRASDGSAFQTCGDCGIDYAVALEEMHYCKFKGRVKKAKLSEDSRSAFCIFMEEFKKLVDGKSWIEIDREGFQKWKNMPKEERKPYEDRAKELNSDYEALINRIEESWMEDDEADSAEVGKIDMEAEAQLQWRRWEDSESSYSDYS
ncbi:high mobility group B protein 7 isoform X1 [Amborella trichopoda]|nr:high mobility group B protein 7 isoform X1 [Amborella trichopoda]|eukprot:XP_020522525.1 high mobility group B protein 7 isoform X1 [Amborella trichopoda]